MKILIANSYHFPGGGDSVYVFNLAELLKNYGHNIAFFAMKDTRNLSDPNEDLFVSHIDYKEINRRKNLFTGLKVMSRSIYSLEAKKKFHRLINRVNPDIIHLNNIHHHITPSIIFVAQEKQIPIIWTLHDYKLLCPNTHFLIDWKDQICEDCKTNKYYRAMVNRCKKGSFLASAVITLEAYVHRLLGVRDKVDYFISPSKFLQKKLVEYGINRYKIKHIPHFIPEHFFKRSLDKGDYFLYLGKLSKIKGIDVLIEGCRIASDCRLLIVGDGEKGIKDTMLSSLPPNVKYLGYQSRERIQKLILESIAVILPSLCYENQPFSILEAFASGKPVIASNLGGMTELVKDGERGLLVPPGDVHALAGAMKWIISHKKEAREMGRNAYKYALENHSPKNYYDKLMEIYHKVLT